MSTSRRRAFLIAIAAVCVGLAAWGTHRVVQMQRRFKQKAMLVEFVRHATDEPNFWERGPNGERFFPIDSQHFGQRLDKNDDGTFTIHANGYRYAPISTDGRRIVNDPSDSETIVLWDPHPLDDGMLIAATASLASYEVTPRDVAAQKIARFQRIP